MDATRKVPAAGANTTKTHNFWRGYIDGLAANPMKRHETAFHQQTDGLTCIVDPCAVVSIPTGADLPQRPSSEAMSRTRRSISSNWWYVATPRIMRVVRAER